MSLIIPDWEERQQIDKERMEIIKSVMRIQNAKELHVLAVMARQYYADSLYDLPLSLNDFVEMLDLPMLVRLSDLFKDEDTAYLANRQIKECLDRAMASYAGSDKDEGGSADIDHDK